MEPVFRVSFFKKLVDSYGHPVDACQGIVEMHAQNSERAVKDARAKFEELTKVSDWSLRADYQSVEVLPVRKRVSASAWTRNLEGHATSQ
jgi:hypothetical protein